MKNKLLKIIRKIRHVLRFFLKKEIMPKIESKKEKSYIWSDYWGFFITPKNLWSDSIVYSFGIWEDITFDLWMIENFWCNVYGFDPTPKSIERVNAQQTPQKFIFWGIGLADHDWNEKRYLPENKSFVSCTNKSNNKWFSDEYIDVKVKKLETIMKEHGHKHIDVLKMDIEWAEYEVLEDILTSEIEISQILIEFHHRFSGIPKEKTEIAIKLLRKYGYKLFAVSDSYQEYSFIKSTHNENI